MTSADSLPSATDIPSLTMSQTNQAKDKTQVCCFCNSSEDNEIDYGKFYECDNVITHYYCVLLSSNMEQRGNDNEGILGFLPKDIQKEVSRAKRVICSYCQRSGATLICNRNKCKKIFHLPCGLRAGSFHLFFGEFRSYCRSHRPRQWIHTKIKQEVVQVEGILCCICYDEVDVKDWMNTLWAPCCKKSTWFHRKCVQRLALSAGYFFKCPLCNNQKEFGDTMKANGIFVPSQESIFFEFLPKNTTINSEVYRDQLDKLNDALREKTPELKKKKRNYLSCSERNFVSSRRTDASWELEPNAFQELLYRHNRCDAVICLCPKGRSYTSKNVKWELILCRICGSQGIHVACTQNKWTTRNWECNDCLSILHSSENRDTYVNLDKSDKSDKSEEIRESDSEDSDSNISVGCYSPVPQSLLNDPIIMIAENDNFEALDKQALKLRPGPRSFKIQQANKLLSKLPTDAQGSEDVRSPVSPDTSDDESSESPCDEEDAYQDFQGDDAVVENNEEVEVLCDWNPKEDVMEKSNTPPLAFAAGETPTTNSCPDSIRQENVTIEEVCDDGIYADSFVNDSVDVKISDAEIETTMNIKISNVTSLAPEEFLNTINLSRDRMNSNLKRKSNVDVTHNAAMCDSVNISQVEQCKKIRSVKTRNIVPFPSAAAMNSSENTAEGRRCSTEKSVVGQNDTGQLNSIHVEKDLNIVDEVFPTVSCTVIDERTHLTSEEKIEQSSRRRHNSIDKKSEESDEDVIVNNAVLRDSDIESTVVLSNSRIFKSLDHTSYTRDRRQRTESHCDGDAGTCPADERKNRDDVSEVSSTFSKRDCRSFSNRTSVIDGTSRANGTRCWNANTSGNNFDCVASNPSACDRPRMIPRYVSLKDLKFRMNDSKGLQMILYDTFSVSLNLADPLKEETNVSSLREKDNIDGDAGGSENPAGHFQDDGETTKDNDQADRVELPTSRADEQFLQSDLSSFDLTEEISLKRKCRSARKQVITNSDFRSDKLSRVEDVYYPSKTCCSESIWWPCPPEQLLSGVISEKDSAEVDSLTDCFKNSQTFESTDISMDSCMKYFNSFDDLNMDNRYSSGVVGTVSNPVVFQYSPVVEENAITRQNVTKMQCAQLTEDEANTEYVDSQSDDCCRVSINLDKIQPIVKANPALFFKNEAGSHSRLSDYVNCMAERNDLMNLINLSRETVKVKHLRNLNNALT